METTPALVRPNKQTETKVTTVTTQPVYPNNQLPKKVNKSFRVFFLGVSGLQQIESTEVGKKFINLFPDEDSAVNYLRASGANYSEYLILPVYKTEPA
jgi:hypothetical protein